MELSIKDRLIILNVLPGQGDITTLRVIMELRAALSFSEEEHAELKFSPPCAKCSKGNWEHRDVDHDFEPTQGLLGWDHSKDGLVKDVPIGSKAHAIIGDAFQMLSSSGQLGMDQIDLYERFVEAPIEITEAKKAGS